MPAKSDQLQWLQLNDFSPGIQQRVMLQGGTVSPSHVSGAATENTFRCIALPGGGLGPLPKRTQDYSIAATDSTTNLVNNRFSISGFHAAGPVGDGPNDPVSLNIAFEYRYTTPSKKYKWTRHRFWESTPTIDTIKSITNADDTSVVPTYFHNYRAHASDATQPGVPCVAAAWHSAIDKFWSIFPDITAPSTNSVTDISTADALDLLIGHQGRSIGAGLVGYDHGPGSSTWRTNEMIHFTNSNLRTQQTSTPETFGQENSTGYGSMGSLSASELFIVKLQGGGYLVRGDVAAPTITRLPGVISTGNYLNTGVTTPIGYVYGVRDGGVWVWNGGEASELLSPQLESTFWSRHGNGDFRDYFGKFGLFREWILTPGNYLYDYRTKSWWLLEDPSLALVFQWSPSVISPTMFGAPRYYTDATTPVAYVWNQATPASSYQWESQPIPQTMDRISNVRQLVLVAHGTGTVVVTLTGSYDTSAVTDTKTFTLAGNSSRPQLLRANTNLNGTHIQVKIVAAHTSTGSAPIIYELRLGIDESPVHVPVV